MGTELFLGDVDVHRGASVSCGANWNVLRAAPGAMGVGDMHDYFFSSGTGDSHTAFPVVVPVRASF